MHPGWSTFSTWCLHAGLGGGLVLLVSWVAVAILRQPARRQWLGECGVLAALLTAVAGLAPAWLVLPWPRVKPPPSMNGTQPVSAHVEPTPFQKRVPTNLPPSLWFPPPEPNHAAESKPASTAVILERVSGTADKPQPRSHRAESVASSAARSAQPRPASQGTQADWPASASARRGVAWLDGLMLVYAAGVFLFLIRWLLGQVALGRLVRRSRPVPLGVRHLFGAMTGQDRRRPRLLASPWVRTPMSFGLLRPTIVLPLNLCELLDAQQMQWVLAHELTHVRRGDPWSCLLFSLGRAVYFYVPWFWPLCRSVRLCQEYIADAAAARDAAWPEDYAQFLLGLNGRPTIAAGALGVFGNTSDLYRRIRMLVQSSQRVERRCPRSWALCAIGGLTALAVVLGGLDVRSRAAGPEQLARLTPVLDHPAKKKNKKVDAKEARQKQIDAQVQQALQHVPPGVNRAVAAEQIRRYLLSVQPPDSPPAGRQSPPAISPPQGPIPPGAGIGRPPGGMMPPMMGMPGGPMTNRLGAYLERPDETLIEQLDLPKDHGLVLTRVLPGSAADKAGFKSHDILLELNGKAVPSNPWQLNTQLRDLKADQKIDAVVLRKGHKKTIKSFTLPEAQFGGMPGMPGMGRPGATNAMMQQMMQMQRHMQHMGAPGMGPPGGPPGMMMPGGRAMSTATAVATASKGVMTTLFKTNDHFTARHQEGNLVITVDGKTPGGKADVNEITVQDGQLSHTYKSLDKVPARYRDKVNNLVDLSAGNNAKIKVAPPAGAKQTEAGPLQRSEKK